MSALSAWLDAPRPDRGVHMAGNGDGWEFRGYPELAASAHRVAARLRAAGVEPGDAVGIVLPSGFPFVEAFYGGWLAGATPCPVAPPGFFADTGAYAGHLAAILRTSGARLAVTDGALAPTVRAAIEAAGLDLPVWVHDDEPAPETGVAQAAWTETGLLQFTSGSTGTPRGVEVSMANLEANVRQIHRWMDWDPDEGSVSWLPLHHDMGLIGALLATVTAQSDLWLMRPEQFLRDPVRWLRCLGDGRAHRATAPTFGYAYALRFMTPERLDGLEFSGWRSAIVGAERVDAGVLADVAERLAPYGFDAGAFLPAYGLAESTLAVTGDAPGAPPVAVLPEWSDVVFGGEVRITATAVLSGAPLPRRDEGWLVGCGPALDGTRVQIVDGDGDELPPGHLGEVAVTGPAVARGYRGSPDSTVTRVRDGRVLTGDAGFVHGGALHVVGRIADSMKIRGRTVYMEDLEARAADRLGLGAQRCALVSSVADGRNALVLLAEARPGDWVGLVPRVLRQDVGDEVDITVVTGRRGLIRRGSSGKPRRRFMWRELQAGRCPGEIVLRDPGTAVAPTHASTSKE
ncbi:AMP-binding protein [Actinomadura terrae]|uniref:AMP-binding protein n=1 Tax=Actinomadura terrae TaxID=604353 RepID=UPI001FA70692|nr:AMP-binding protein [Actinomadura terrae]